MLKFRVVWFRIKEHEKISGMFIDYINRIAPDYVRVKVTPMHGGEGYVCPIDLPAYKAAEKGYEDAFEKKPLAVRRGVAFLLSQLSRKF